MSVLRPFRSPQASSCSNLLPSAHANQPDNSVTTSFGSCIGVVIVRPLVTDRNTTAGCRQGSGQLGCGLLDAKRICSGPVGRLSPVLCISWRSLASVYGLEVARRETMALGLRYYTCSVSYRGFVAAVKPFCTDEPILFVQIKVRRDAAGTDWTTVTCICHGWHGRGV